LGYEKQYNSRVRITDRDTFIEQKIKEHHYLPPYFKTMERLNLTGTSAAAHSPKTPPLAAEELERCLADDAIVVDVRTPEAFCSGHIPGSLALPVDMVPAFAGWLLKEDDKLVLVADSAEQAETAIKQLARIGFDHVAGYLPGILEWITTGRAFDSLPPVDVDTVSRRLSEKKDNWNLLDVRAIDEVEDAKIENSLHVYLGELPNRLIEFDPDPAYTVMCGSGVRATVAASILRAAGMKKVDVFLGSMAAWAAKSQ